MRYVLFCEIIVLFGLPFLMVSFRRRGINFEKPMAFAFATVFSLLMGTYWLYLKNPQTVSSLTLTDWLSAVVFALLCWVFVYPVSRWLYKQWFQ